MSEEKQSSKKDVSASERPVPVPNADSRPYWDAANHKSLAYQRCDACGQVQFPPRGHCVHCHRGPLRWETSAGRGEIHAFTVIHRAPTPAFRAAVPYAMALVDFSEGFRLLLNVQGVALADLRIGLPVQVTFEELSNGQWLPQAGPVS